MYPVPEIGSFAIALFIRGPLDSGLRRSDGRLNSKCDCPDVTFEDAQYTTIYGYDVTP